MGTAISTVINDCDRDCTNTRNSHKSVTTLSKLLNGSFTPYDTGIWRCTQQCHQFHRYALNQYLLMFLSFPLPDFRRHSSNSFECLVCPRRGVRASSMTASHAREHLSSGVHQRYSRTASQGSSSSFSMAGPDAPDVMDDTQHPLSADSVRINLLYHTHYLTSS